MFPHLHTAGMLADDHYRDLMAQARSLRKVRPTRTQGRLVELVRRVTGRQSLAARGEVAGSRLHPVASGGSTSRS